MGNYNQNDIYKNAANFGLILGLVVVMASLISYFIGSVNNIVASYIPIVFSAVAITFGTKNLRDKFQNGYISYARALGSGVLIALFGAVIQSFYTYVFFTYISPESLTTMFDTMEQTLISQGQDEEQINAAMQMSKQFMGPVSIAISGVLSATFWGFILSLISAAFVKKDESIFDE
jgi:ethanolamine transporter EutH